MHDRSKRTHTINERIDQLATQANCDVGQVFAEILCNDTDVNVKIAEVWNSQPDEVRVRIFNTVEQNIHAFAHSIIAECLQTIVNHTPTVDNPQMEDYWDLGYAQAMKDCLLHIRERFGVEE